MDARTQGSTLGNNGNYPAPFFSIDDKTFSANTRMLFSVIRSSSSPSSWTQKNYPYSWGDYWVSDIIAVNQPDAGNNWAYGINYLVNPIGSSNTLSAILSARIRRNNAQIGIMELNLITSQSNCWRLYQDPSRSRYIAACTSGLVTMSRYTSTGQYQNMANADTATWVPLGVGDFTSGIILPERRRLYLGSSIGLLFEVDLNTLSLLRVTLLSSGGVLSPFTGVYFDTPSTSPFGVLYWGTSDGNIARVNLRDFNVFSSASLAVDAGININDPSVNTNLSLLIGGSTGAGNDINTFYAMGAGPINQGWSNSFRSYKVSMVDCSMYSCTQCNSNPVDLDYCGWCVNTGTCTRIGSCTGAPRIWQQNQTCPAPLALSPVSGSTAGGTVVTYYGTNFSPAGVYYCKWSSSGVYFAGTLASSTAIRCTTPSFSSTAPVTLSIYYQAVGSSLRLYSDPIAFTPYDCSAATTCSDCQAFAVRNPECGWCFRKGICSARTTCESGASGALVTNDWSANVMCPTVSAIGSSSASGPTATALTLPLSEVQNGATNISIAVTSWVFPSNFAVSGYQCLFTAIAGSTAGTPTTVYRSDVTAANSATGRIYCNIPGNIASIGTAVYGVSVSTKTDATKLIAPGPATGLTIYKCDAIEACYECNLYSKCTWCVNADSTSTKCLIGTSAQCGTNFTQSTTCSKVTSYTPTQASLYEIQNNPNLFISVTGTQLDLASSNLKTCYFILGSETLTSQMEDITATTAKCPFPAGITAGNWSFSLGSPQSRQTQSYSFFIYSCASFTTCDTCVTADHPLCDWCLDIDNGGPLNSSANTGCADSTHALSCSTTWLTARNVCPSIASSSPNNFPLSGNASLTLYGNYMIAENNVSLVDCHFELPPTSSTGTPTDLGYTTATWNDTVNAIACDVPASTTAGVASVSLVSSIYNPQLYATATNINFITCSDFTTCDTCLAGETFCTWCGATCTDSCSNPAWEADVCPNVTSISPNYSAGAGGEIITISGTGFLRTGMKKREEAYSTGSAPKTGSSASISELLAQAEARKRATAAEADIMADTGMYACDFGGIQSTAEVNAAGTAITCTTPAKSTIGPSILNVLFNGNLYLSTTGITYFTCDTSVSASSCTPVCTNTQYCGWCVAEARCSSHTQCRNTENVVNPVWQSERCPSATLNRAQYPTAGKFPMTATLSSLLPSSVLTSDVQCVFGGGVSDEVVTNATSIGVVSTVDSVTGSLVNVSSITCPTPSWPGAATAKFSATYKSNALISDVDLVYADCSIYKDCTRCLSIPYCGWCGSGGKCTMDVQCTGTWSRRSCPANKVAIGVGVGIGLFVLILLALLLVYIIRRYRNKDGLVIALKEPNYFEIAWGADTTLWWKIPSEVERYVTLERQLSRQDFLLQVAIAFNCPATEQDALAKAMVYVASAHHIAASMIQTCIRYEVQTCKEENTLFRSNSVASKMYKFFSRIVGIKYLFNCIARVIMELEVLGRRQIQASDAHAAAAASQSSGGASSKAGKGSPANSVDVSLLTMTMELDQTKALGDDIDTDTNLLQLQLICQKLLNVLIKTSVRNIPADFRKIFIEIDNSVMSKFGSDDAVYKGIGGLFFLRFVCPALTAPHVYGLLETPPNQVTQRQLVLITKVIQNIANMQEPGKKEEYMAALSDFIVKSIPKIVVFYDNLRAAVNLSDNVENYETQVIEVPDEVKMNGLAAVANFLHTETPKLRNWVQSETCPFDDMAKSDLNQMLDELQEAHPKPPKKLSGTSGAASATSQLDAKKKKKKTPKE